MRFTDLVAVSVSLMTSKLSCNFLKTELKHFCLKNTEVNVATRRLQLCQSSGDQEGAECCQTGVGPRLRSFKSEQKSAADRKAMRAKVYV